MSRRRDLLAQGEQGRLADNRGDRPLLRGWLHVAAFIGWLIGGPFLIAAGPRRGGHCLLTVYVASQLVMFGTSAAFHRIRWSALGLAPHAPGRSQRHLRGHRRYGHRGGRLVTGRMGRGAGASWPGSARVAGIALRQVWLDAPQWVVAIPYVVVGWCPIVVAPQLVRALGGAGFVIVLLAGLVDTAGALVYALKRPDPWPRVFGFHEVFHTCTLVGAAMFAYVVAFIALPRY